MECGWGGRAEGLVNDLAGLAHDVEPGLLSGDDAGRLAGLFTRAERLCGVLKTVCAKRAAECSTWTREGFRSEQEWYAQMIGAGVGTAREALELAGQLDDQPELAEAWKAGDLSSAQTKEITKAAQADPASAPELIRKAKRSSHKGLKDACRQAIANARSAEDEAARHRRLHDGRYCRLWVDDDGAGRVEARLTPEALATIQACLDPFARAEFDLARAQGRRERHEAYLADALVAMARAAAGQRPTAGDDPAGDDPASDGDDNDRSGGPGGPTPNGPAPSGPRPAGPPSTVIAVVSHDALLRGYTEGGETCVIDGVGPVPVATVRAMAADAFLAAVVTDGHDIRTVAHRGRQATARQRTALAVRDPECVVPGCHVRVGLEIDHVTGWTVTHVTTIDDLARLCHHHHHLKTHDGWALAGPPGQWTWTRPGTPTDRAGPQGQGDTGPPGPPPITLFDP